MGLTALDIIVFLLVGGGAVLGFMRGFVCEMLSLLAWVAGVAALYFFHQPVEDMLAAPVGTHAGAAVLAFVVVFGFVFLLGKLLSRRMGKRVRTSVVGPIDRLLGGGFGVLKGLIGATILYLAGALAYDTIWGAAAERPAWMTESRSYPLLHASGKALVDFVSERRGEPTAEYGADT